MAGDGEPQKARKSPTNAGRAGAVVVAVVVVVEPLLHSNKAFLLAFLLAGFLRSNKRAFTPKAQCNCANHLGAVSVGDCPLRLMLDRRIVLVYYYIRN